MAFGDLTNSWVQGNSLGDSFPRTNPGANPSNLEYYRGSRGGDCCDDVLSFTYAITTNVATADTTTIDVITPINPEYVKVVVTDADGTEATGAVSDASQVVVDTTGLNENQAWFIEVQAAPQALVEQGGCRCEVCDGEEVSSPSSLPSGLVSPAAGVFAAELIDTGANNYTFDGTTITVTATIANANTNADAYALLQLQVDNASNNELVITTISGTSLFADVADNLQFPIVIPANAVDYVIGLQFSLNNAAGATSSDLTVVTNDPTNQSITAQVDLTLT